MVTRPACGTLSSGRERSGRQSTISRFVHKNRPASGAANHLRDVARDCYACGLCASEVGLFGRGREADVVEHEQEGEDAEAAFLVAGPAAEAEVSDGAGELAALALGDSDGVEGLLVLEADGDVELVADAVVIDGGGDAEGDVDVGLVRRGVALEAAGVLQLDGG